MRDDNAALLKRNTTLARLSPAALKLLATAASSGTKGAGEAIVMRGSASDEVYLLLEGEVVLKGEKTARVAKQTMFGLVALYGGPARADALAGATGAIYLKIPANELRAVMSASPSIQEAVLRDARRERTLVS